MAGSLLFIKDMNKRLLGLSCSSVASASVITGRAIDRHSPHLRDHHRSMSKPPKARPTTGSRDDSFSSSKQQLYGKKKKSSTSTSTRSSSSSSSSSGIKRFVSPASSSRFLLNSSRLQSDDVNVAELALPPPPPPQFIDIFPGDAMPVPFPGEEAPAVQLAESSAGSSAASSSSSEIAAVVGISSRDHDEKAVIMRSCSTRTQDQVVVLRVSLHCKGCAGKVKKHISKMEGVASFDIDIATKKVTVVGNVTPLAVLSSICKVKPAQFWPSPPRPPRASASF